MKKYQPQLIEPKWQEKWSEDKLYQAKDGSEKPKKYVLDFFPYPSGDGIHVGHLKGYTATDILSRYYRVKGFNVLHPMGWDAFGLPAENYALKKGLHPRITTAQNISNIKKQMQMVGLSYDWSREINTTDPNYYRWTQWIFIQMFKEGLAYEAELPINFCPSCKTGLANEEVIGGECERCHTQVVRKTIRQWVLRITKYADRLVEDLDQLNWPDFIKEMQRNWIGKSEGSRVKFKIKNKDYSIETFTTRVDTIYGVTALILAPEHKNILDLTTTEHKKEVEEYVTQAQNKSDLERTQLTKNKTGVFTGGYAINPINGEQIPIWVADYVLGFYGTGAVMLVPAHDKRDEEFAKKFGLEIRQVINEQSGVLIASDKFTGLTINEAKKAITDYLKKDSSGDFEVQYKLRDWLFSRQRYWGEPIPIVHCQKCGLVPVPEKDLPVLLPEVERYEPTGTGQSPLANITDWVNTTCPQCDGPAKRETNTMPQWAGSCWYYLRFIDPNNNTFLVDPDLEKYWMPVDWYVGGAEHAVLHLLYARFWHKFLYDIKAVSTKEPFTKLSSVGLVLAEDGRKMSKSLGNVVTPDQIVAEYGADTLRVYEAFMGPFENTISWDPASINGMHHFLERVWGLFNKMEPKETPILKDLCIMHKTIKKVGEDIESIKNNTAIASLMEWLNYLSRKDKVSLEEYKVFLQLLSPFAPHITEELWETIGENYSVHRQSWPTFDKKYLEEEEALVVIQVNGKVRSQLTLPHDQISNQQQVSDAAKSIPQIQKYLEGKEIVKEIYIPGKILNLVVNQNSN